MTFDVAKAQAELQQKTITQIQAETAYVWGSRAMAALRYYKSNGTAGWLANYQSYLDEAIEHAALAGLDLPQFLSEMSQLVPYSGPIRIRPFGA